MRERVDVRSRRANELRSHDDKDLMLPPVLKTAVIAAA
jgi:hypothetical protein